MKVYALIAVILLESLGSIQSLPETSEDSVNRIWPIPQVDGSVRYMTREEAALEAMLTEPLAKIRKSKKVRFFLYTRQNLEEPREIDASDPDTLTQSFFNADHPTRFMLHPWRGAYDDDSNEQIRNALFSNDSSDRQYNYFAVDWTVYGTTINYISAQAKVSDAGKAVANFIDWLHLHANLSYNTLAVYGFSLGAQVAGFTGKHVQIGQVHTIVGMDPAMPLFKYNNPATRIADTDAYYVESIQTNGGTFGFFNPIGRAAFYPNGGKSQPVCGFDILGLYSHARSLTYFVEALSLGDKNGFNVVGCSNLDEVQNANCAIEAKGIRMGDKVNAEKAAGIYYLTTNAKPPFGKNVGR